MNPKLKKFLARRVPVYVIILGMILANVAHVYLDSKFPHIF